MIEITEFYTRRKNLKKEIQSDCPYYPNGRMKRMIVKTVYIDDNNQKIKQIESTFEDCEGVKRTITNVEVIGRIAVVEVQREKAKVVEEEKG